ncbi:2OG-Fe(II) oxygenase [Microbulbifer hydrolyticus]|uniref:2OG-Fe(II) oxygenase n=1 Tax=Microbulbifer hydrolyticus TaxID=48074 RepID=A0A6P1TEA8_9GAMM|nr:2OG-Fe(II) oxygenase family protein [Microbulbifer hydrolyticus]MBB5212353.1 Rps23 Pro-64 3,4-dihydroxylase Tpa1-like proline 4-hydroxylase [Microbulbifer hydrolyticus]QHQ39995.1 2OG-Fe(II) oxygenase [Microbulbifer hydrolyticus]
MYHISDSLDIRRYSSDFEKRGFVQISEFLNNESANALWELLESQSEWNLVFNRQGKHVDLSYRDYCSWSEEQKKALNEYIWQSATDTFGYFYKSIPVFDIYKNNILPGNPLNNLYELVNSKPFLSLMRILTGEESIAFADVQATSYDRGHFLKIHDDNVSGKNRVAAYVINLTKNWSPDWGGLFHLFDGEENVVGSLVPAFNAINVFKVPQKHSVSYVTPFAATSRYSITGWLRRDTDAS